MFLYNYSLFISSFTNLLCCISVFAIYLHKFFGLYRLSLSLHSDFAYIYSSIRSRRNRFNTFFVICYLNASICYLPLIQAIHIGCNFHDYRLEVFDGYFHYALCHAIPDAFLQFIQHIFQAACMPFSLLGICHSMKGCLLFFFSHYGLMACFGIFDEF